MSSEDPLLSPEVFGRPNSDVMARACLHSGARWEGVQRSGRNSYSVRVTFDYVSLADCVVNGCLEIHGLTPELPSLQTWFSGEIIGDKGPQSGFITGRWGATEADDMKHWSRFPPFRSIRNQLVKPHLNFSHTNRSFLFMRWKEQFVVPPREVQNIHGASYAGFYYLCLDLSPTLPTSPLNCDLRPLSPTPPFPRTLQPLRSASPERPRVRLPRTSNSRPLASPTLPDEIIEEEGSVGVPRAGRPDVATPVALRPRRSSSAAFSYADAAAGRAALASPPSTGLGLSSPIQIPNSSAPDPAGSGPPKDLDIDATISMSIASASSNSSQSTFFSDSPSSYSSVASSTPPIPIAIPTPHGTTLEDFPTPSSPPLGSLRQRSGSVSSVTSPVGSWARAARGRGSGSSRGGQSIDAVILDDTESGHMENREMGRTASTNRAEHRRPRGDRRESFGERERGTRESGHEKWGMNSWAQATMTGFYHFRNSEPYQELALTYVPQHRGGTQTFEFR